MKVADAMSRQVDYVTTEATVQDVSRLIFGRGINGVPVCKGKKVVGFIIERDILAQFYPSMQEYMEDPVHARDFEGMERKTSEILELKVEEIMSKDPTTVTPDAPLLQAQSLMAVHKVGRLPVVDSKGALLGILSRGDIFRAVVGGKIPYLEDEEYHDWLSRRYDLIVRWKTRLGHEIPDLVSLLHKEKVKIVLDVGCGTGEHDIALAEKGFEVTGLERSKLMLQSSKEKWNSLPRHTQKRLEFIKGEYVKILEKKNEEFGAAIFMGNALSHNPHNFEKVMEAVSKSLVSKNALIILQIVNFEKVFKTNKRLQDFNIAKSKLGGGREHAFLEFYDPPRSRSGFFTLNMVVLNFDGKRWSPRGLNSTLIANINKNNIRPLLQKLGFKKISFYGGMLLGPLFKESFKPLEHDWLNVVAKR